MLFSAMAEVSAASGLHLQYVGPTTRRPGWPDHTLTVEGGAWPVLVAFATPAELPAMEGKPGSVAAHRSRGTLTTYVTGTVVLETDYFNGLLDRSGAWSTDGQP